MKFLFLVSLKCLTKVNSLDILFANNPEEFLNTWENSGTNIQEGCSLATCFYIQGPSSITKTINTTAYQDINVYQDISLSIKLTTLTRYPLESEDSCVVEYSTDMQNTWKNIVTLGQSQILRNTQFFVYSLPANIFKSIHHSFSLRIRNTGKDGSQDIVYLNTVILAAKITYSPTL